MRAIMFIVVAVFSFVAVLSLAGFVGAAEPEAFRIGSVKVWAVADNTGDRDMSAFIGDPEVIKQYPPVGNRLPAFFVSFWRAMKG